jgi:DNA modification methylase
MSHTIIQADVLKGLASLPDGSVQCVVTSPPYWGLRDYGMEGQIGLEPTPEEYVEKMVRVFREVRRVLRKDGTVWLNMGDCYSPQSSHPAFPELRQGFNQRSRSLCDNGQRPPVEGLKPKDLVGMPWRLAFALQADGWWLRSDIVWSKPNPMPESVTDRPTKSHEFVFLLAKSSSYFYDADAIREPHKEESIARVNRTHHTSGHKWENGPGDQTIANDLSSALSVGGRNRRTVWEIPTQPFPEAHFATFPGALVEPCIKAGTSERGCCPKCGSPWVRMVEKGEPDEDWKAKCGADSAGEYNGISHKQMAVTAHPPNTRPNDLHKQDALGKPTYTGFNARYKEKQVQNASDVKRRILEGMRERMSTWVPGCTCGGEPVPCVVLDPFAGSGTVAKVTRELGRSSVSIEINPAYVEMIKKRMRYYEQLSPEVVIAEIR